MCFYKHWPFKKTLSTITFKTQAFFNMQNLIFLQAVTKDRDSILICTRTKFKGNCKKLKKKHRIHIPVTTNYMI